MNADDTDDTYDDPFDQYTEPLENKEHSKNSRYKAARHEDGWGITVCDRHNDQAWIEYDGPLAEDGILDEDECQYLDEDHDENYSGPVL